MESREIQQLLDMTTGNHGYWLINHIDIIRDELVEGLKRHGLNDMVAMLNDRHCELTKRVYKKIRRTSR